MKLLFTTCFCYILFVSNFYGQTPEEKQRLKYEAEIEERKQEYISDFIETLDADDFQKEIIKQQMESYFDEVKKINLLQLRQLDHEELVQKLDDTHFTDLKAMLTEEQISKIMDAVKGKWNHSEEKKKKKKKEKNRKKNKSN